jgi:homoserine kinase type II
MELKKYNSLYAEKLLKKYYDFLKITKIQEFDSGWANYSFYVKTKNKKFVIQIIGETPNRKLIENLKLQIKALNYLKENKFPYKIPSIIKNNNGKQLSFNKDRYFFVYEYIEGKILDKFNINNFKEYAKATAQFTKIMDRFLLKNKKDLFNIRWLNSEFNKIGKIKPQNELDKLVVSNLEFIKKILSEISLLTNFGRVRLIHADFNRTNVLFENNNLTGIIDFHNLEIAPISKEIGVAISRTNFLKKGYSKAKENIFMKEFEKHYKLTKIEKESIIPIILRDNCAVIWWKYLHLEKNRDTAYSQIKSVINETKKVYKIWNG